MLNNTVEYQAHDFKIENYKEWVDVEALREKARKLRGLRVLHINSVSYGGGVAAILSKLVPAFNDLGIESHWYVPKIGSDEFFAVTKKQHNMFQGQENASLSSREKNIYWDTQDELLKLLKGNIGDYDIIVIHDTQYLGAVRLKDSGKSKWIYRCHIDTSAPNPSVINFFKPLIMMFDATIFHLKDFIIENSPMPFVIPPSIDPLEPKNSPYAVSKEYISKVMESFGLDISRPILLQVGRFDPAKGYETVTEIFKSLKPMYPKIQLLLTGAGAKDDPQFKPYLEKVRSLVRGVEDAVVRDMPFDVVMLNAVQRAATVVYAMSKREGFGLVVSEASVKERPVIVSNAGGLPIQVVDGKTGFVVGSVEEAVEKTSLLLDNKELRVKMGREGRKYILSKFIIPIHAGNYLDMFTKVVGL